LVHFAPVCFSLQAVRASLVSALVKQPEAVTAAAAATDYFEVEARAGQIILTPVRIQRGDSVRAKLAELGLSDADVSDAVAWSRAQLSAPALVAETMANYSVWPARTLCKN
jgi:hypothetical protein